MKRGERMCPMGYVEFLSLLSTGFSLLACLLLEGFKVLVIFRFCSRINE